MLAVLMDTKDLENLFRMGGAPMATVNSVSPRDEVEAAKARVAVQRSQSDASGESDAVVDVPFTLPSH